METRLAPSTKTPFEDTLQYKFYALDSLKTSAREATRDEGFRGWLDTASGVESLESYRRYLDHYLDAACTRVIDKSLTLLLDRLEFGDICYSKEGEQYRSELKAIALSKIFAAVFDRRQLIREKPTQISSESDSLEKIANALDKLGANKPTMIAVNVVNSLATPHVEEFVCQGE